MQRTPFSEYVKAAFTWHWNLLFFGAGAAFSLLSAPTVVLPLVLAGEVAYLGLLTSRPRFRASVDVKLRSANSPVDNNKQIAQIRSVLKPEAWQRFEELRRRCVTLSKLAEQFRGPGSASDLAVNDLQTSSLERLLWMFLKLLYSQDALTRFINGVDRVGIQRDLQAAEKKLADATARGRESKLVSSIEDTLQTLKQRLANYDRAAENLELLTVEIARIEQKVNAIGETAINTRETTDISAQVDGIAAGISATEEAMKSLEVAPVFDQDVAPRLLRETA